MTATQSEAAVREHGGWERETSGQTPQPYCTTRPPAAQPVYSASGRVVGEVQGQTLRKAIRGSVHMLQKPRAIAWDLTCLEQAEALGATRVEVLDVETNTLYTAALAAFWRDGIKVNRGHGEQVALPLDRWTVYRRGERVGVQLTLFGEGQP